MEAGAEALIQGVRDYGGLLGLAVTAAIVAAVAYYRHKLRYLEEGFDFLRIRAALADEGSERWLTRYRGRLDAVLDRLDFWFGPGLSKIPVRLSLARIPWWRAAPLYWSAYAFGVHLTFAVVYPALLLMLFWAVGGTNASGMDILPDNMAPWWRYAAITAPIFVVTSIYYSLSEERFGWKDLAWVIVVAVIAVVGSIFDLFAVIGASGVAAVIPFIIAGSYLAVSIGIRAVVTGVLVSVASILDGAVLLALAIAMVGINFFASAFFNVGAVVEERIYDVLQRMRWKGYQLWILFIFVCLAVTAISFGIHGIVTKVWGVYSLIFYVLLPIFNAFYDWLSLGLMRYLLRRALDEERHFFLYSLLHLVAAIVFLVALSITIVAAISGLNAIAPTDKPPIDLAGILHMLRSEPGNPALWWIYAMIFSPLLPTFFHAGVALTSLPMLRFMPRWRRRVAQQLHGMQDPGDSHEVLVKAALYLTGEKVWMWGSAMIVLGALLGLLLWAVPGLGRLLLFLCEETARLLGTDITPGPIAPFIRWS